MVFGWAAIQETGDNGDVDITDEEVITKEQQEAKILELYDSGIKGQKEGNTDVAKEKYMELLDHPLVKEEMDATTKKLKFLALKNLGGIEKACGKKREALEYYAGASDVDPSDIGVWYNIGCISMDLSMLCSSRYAFEKGLSCHPQDWGCLEKLMHVLEASGDEAAYLKVNSRAMMLDPSCPILQSKRSKLLRLHQATQALSLDKFPIASMDPVEAQEEEEPHKLTVGLSLGTSDKVWTEFGRVLYDLWNGGAGQGGSLVWMLEKEEEGEDEGRVEGKGEVGEKALNSRGKTKRVTEAERLKALGQTKGGAGPKGRRIEELNAGEEGSGDGKVVRRVSRRQQTRVQNRTQRTETDEEEETFVDVVQDVVGGHESGKVDWWGQAIGRMVGGSSGSEGTPLKHMYDEGAKLAKNMLQSFQGIHNNDCHICGDGGDLLCCETCSTVYHPTCLIRPPGPTEDLYCEECKQEALSLSNNEAPVVIKQDLFRSQYESIAADFLPTVEENSGVLDVMRKFIVRVSSIQDPRVWKEEKDLPSIALKVAKSCKSYSRDIMTACREQRNDLGGAFDLDFDFECSLFLMEVALDQVIKKASPNSLHEHGRDLAACDEFIAAVLEVLSRNMPEGFDAEDGERLVLPDEILCRFWLLCTQLYALRGSVNEALFCVKQLEAAFRQMCLSKEGLNPGVGSTELISSFELPIPHLVAFPVLTLTSIQVKEASIISSGQMRDRVDKGNSLQQLIVEQKGQDEEARRDFLKYVMERVVGEDGKGDQEFLEEIVMDLLTVDTKLLTNKDEAGLLEVTAEQLRTFSPKGSMLHMALFAALQLGDMTAALGLTVRVVWYVTYIDRCADRCIKKMVTMNPTLLQQHNDTICKAGVRVLDYLATFLATITKCLAPDAAKEILGMDETVLPTLVEVMMALYKNSTLMFSSALLEASMVIYERLGPLSIEIEKGAMKGLCGVICDGEMSRNVLLNYLNTKEAQKYAHTAVRCLATMVERCAAKGAEGNVLAMIFTEAEKEEVEKVLLDLLRLTDDDETSYGAMRFHIVYALVNILQINMAPERCANMFCLAHDLLARKNSCKESNGVFLHSTLRYLYKRFPKMLQQPEEVEEAGDGEAEGHGTHANRLLSMKVNAMAAQCFRCLYDCSIDPNTKEHEPIDLNEGTGPQGFRETIQLAVYCLRFLEEEGSFGKKKDVLTSLSMIYQDPQIQEPILTPPYYTSVSNFFFHADPLLRPPDLLKHVDPPEDEDDVYAYGELGTAVPLKDLLFVYRRLYYYIGQFSTHPKLLGKKGQREWELFLEYEKENLRLAHIHLNDLKFNPTRVPSWVELSRTLVSLLYAYLDKSTACEYEDQLSSFLNPLDLSVFLEPIFPAGAARKLHDKLMADKTIESYLDACLTADPPENQAFLTLKPSEDISDETFQKSWMCLVTSAYRSMALKACTVTAELSRDMLAADDGDKKVAERALDCYLQQAVVWYVGLADTNDKMKQRKQVGEVLRLLGEVREVETTYDTALRWDHPYLLGKAKEKLAKMDASLTGSTRYQSNPRRLKEILTLYNDALQLVDSKSSKLEAFYRLHATRLKVIMEDVDEEKGHLKQATRDTITILQRFTFSTDENFYPKEASADTLRRFVFLDCMEAMAECRRQDRYNHRSMYRRARGLLVKNFYLGLRGGEEDVTSRTEEAKECMFLLFDKKRPQVVGAWMPEERKDSFEAINQRYRKYDRMRIKYFNLFLDLLKRTNDFNKLTGFHSWIKTLKEGDQVVQWMQVQTLLALLEMLKNGVERIANQPDEVSAELLSLLDLAYDITMELLTDKTDPAQDLTPRIMEEVQMILPMTVRCCRQLFDHPGGGEVEAPDSNISFEEALSYCHAKWPEKQGKQKLQRKMGKAFKGDDDQKHNKRGIESVGESASQTGTLGQESMAVDEGEESESSGSQNSPRSHQSKNSDRSAAKKRKIQKEVINVMSSDEN